MPKAYWISTFSAIHDPVKLDAYSRLTGPAMHAAGGRFLARGNPAAAFESGTPMRTTLIELPDVDAAVAAYHSTAYQEALRVLADAPSATSASWRRSSDRSLFCRGSALPRPMPRSGAKPPACP